MSILEQIMKMKKEGVPDEKIISELSGQGVSLREIDDALKQMQIKNAVSDSGGNEGMQPSIMQENPPSGQSYQPGSFEQQTPSPKNFIQEGSYQPQAYPQPQQNFAPQETAYQPQEQQQYYAPAENSGQYSQMSGSTDTMIEISDQVFSNKIKNFQKILEATSEAEIALQAKTETISERLKKIETIIDKLQISILDKVGSYGKNLESIKKEMSMMEDSFSKMISSKEKKSEK